MPVEKCPENIQSSHISTLKARKKEYANAKTNTDPWLLQCPTCKQGQKMEFAFGTGTIDISEYAKAINYINSIHALINECLSKQNPCGPSSQQPIKPSFSMPDLPNFLAVLSCLNINSSRTTLHTISRTTSTSSLSNSCTVINKQTEKDSYVTHNSHRNEDYRKIELQHTCTDQDGTKKKNHQHINHKEMQLRKCKTANQPSYPPSHQILAPDRNNLMRDFNQIFNDKKIIANSPPKIPIENESDFKQKIEKNKACFKQHLTRRSRNRSRSPMCYPLIEADSTKLTDETKDKEQEPVLSEADIDRYATELLVGNSDIQLDGDSLSKKTYAVPIQQPPSKIGCEKCRPSKTRIHQMPSSEPVKRKILEKLKEVTPSLKESRSTLIAVRQNRRSNMYVNSNVSKIPIKKQNSDTSSNDASPVMESKNLSRSFKNNDLESDMPDKIVHSGHKAISSPNGILVRDETNIRPHEDIQYLKIATDNKGFAEKMYKVRQKDDDDFVCTRKSVKGRICKQPPEGISFTNQQIRFSVIPVSPDNLICDDSFGKRTYKSPQPYLAQSRCSKKNSRHDLVESSKKSSCSSLEGSENHNKAFGQSQSDCSNDEEVINIQNYISQYKQINISDTNSNCSRTTGSSDIKSDHKSIA